MTTIAESLTELAQKKRLVIQIDAGYVCIDRAVRLADGSSLLIPCLPLTYRDTTPPPVWEPKI